MGLKEQKKLSLNYSSHYYSSHYKLYNINVLEFNKKTAIKIKQNCIYSVLIGPIMRP